MDILRNHNRALISGSKNKLQCATIITTTVVASRLPPTFPIEIADADYNVAPELENKFMVRMRSLIPRS